jgi:phage tail tube protein FII
MPIRKQPLYVLVAVDVRRGTNDGTSRANTVSKLALPELKHKTTNFAPGGGVGERSIVLPQLEPILPKFELKGFDDEIMASMGFMPGINDIWTFAGALVDKQAGTTVPARAIIKGNIATFTPDESEIGGLMGCNYEIQEVTHYEFTIDGKEHWYVDLDENEIRVGGVSRSADVNRALGIA